jgi:hypothetical protein
LRFVPRGCKQEKYSMHISLAELAVATNVMTLKAKLTRQAQQLSDSDCVQKFILFHACLSLTGLEYSPHKLERQPD